MQFVGRRAYIKLLEEEYAQVADTGEGRFILIRGRRRVGKSRLVQEFLRRKQPPSVFFTASRQSPTRELQLFSEAVARSNLTESDGLTIEGDLRSWETALTLIASTARTSEPTVLIIDEFPYLIEDRIAVEGTFQKMWDRVLERAPMLLIVIGSDIATMDALTQYDRPLYGRPNRYVTIPPFSPAEVGEMLDVDAASAIDAYMVVGGFPLVAGSWPSGADLWGFLEESLRNPTSPLIVDGERSISAEFPPEAQASQVLSAIGAGERTFTAIGQASGVRQTSLQRALELLVRRKGVVDATRPLSARASSRDRRYVVADPYLRFWLRFIAPSLDELERQLGHMVYERVRAAWSDYRGRAVEPLIRESIRRMLPDTRFGAAHVVGSYWTRGNDVEVDLVMADRSPRTREVSAIGSIKWREEKPFDRHDRDELVRLAKAVPGAMPDTVLFGVSRAGFSTADLDVELGPEDIVKTWPGLR